MRTRSRHGGFTMIEVLTSALVLLAIAFGMFGFQKYVRDANASITGSLDAQREAREALKRMSQEIRTASPSSVGGYPLEQAGTSSIVFYANTDQDAYKERLRYFLSGKTLKRGLLKPSGSPLAYNPANETISDVVHNVVGTSTPIFLYYDENYDGTTPPLSSPVSLSAVRLIKLTLQIDQDPMRAPGALTLTTQIMMRNLKGNL